MVKQKNLANKKFLSILDMSTEEVNHVLELAEKLKKKKKKIIILNLKIQFWD
jgi:ornithine carbamoyltransferase